MGYFLFSSSFTESEDPAELASIKQEENNWNKIQIQTDTIVHGRQKQEKLLAQNEVKEHIRKPEANMRNEEQVFSFGSKSFEISSSPDTNRIQQELRTFEEEKCAIAEKIIRLNLKLKSGGVSQTDYDTSIDSLYFQRDQLFWKEVKNLLRCSRKEEVLVILDELRRSESQYRCKADSLYNELSQ